MEKDVLKVGVVPMELDLEVTKGQNGEIKISGGMEGKFLEILSTYVGFAYQLVIPQDGQWGYETDNGSWTGIIEMVRMGETDLGLGYLAITESRFKAVKFSTPYNIADKTFVTNPPNLLTLTTTFISPFSMELWIGCLILLLTFPIVLSRATSVSYLDAIVQTFGTFCKQHSNALDKSKKIRFLTGSWNIFVTILTLSYCGVLPSFLTVSLKEKGINSIHDLYEAVNKRMIKCLAPKGSSELDVLFQSEHHDVRSIGHIVKQNKWWYDLRNGRMVDNLKENTALVGLRLFFSSPDFATKIVSKESFGVYNVGIALKAGFCCTKRLNTIILRILSAGFFEKLVSDNFFITELSLQTSQKNSPENIRSLTLEDMYGVFLLLVFGYSTACVCFFGEIIVKVYVRYARHTRRKIGSR